MKTRLNKISRRKAANFPGRLAIRAVLRTAVGLPLATLGFPQSYVVTPIAEAPPYFINSAYYRVNDAGQVSGTLLDGSGKMRAFRWTPNGPNGTSGSLSLLPLGSYSYTHGNGLNASGDVVGVGPAANNHRALLWPAGGGNPVSLGGGGNGQLEAYAINDGGDVACWSSIRSAHSIAVSRLRNGKRTLYTLDQGFPADINNLRYVLGWVEGNSGSGGVPYYTPNATATGWTKQIISTGNGFDLNEHNEAVGVDGFGRPFLYLPVAKYGLSAGKNDLWDLIFPFMAPPVNPFATWVEITATGINDSGVVVGHGLDGPSPGHYYYNEKLVWIWDSVNGPRDLNQLLAGTGWSLVNEGRGPRINNAGQVIATGRFMGGPAQAVLLTPQ